MQPYMQVYTDTLYIYIYIAEYQIKATENDDEPYINKYI